MGQAIIYCVKCQTQLRSGDFDKGLAFHIKGQGYCKKCARDRVLANPDEFPEPLDKPDEKTPVGSLSERKLKAAAAAPHPPPAKSRANPALIIGGLVAAAVVLGLLFAMTRGGSPVARSAEPVEAAPPEPSPPPKRDPPPKETPKAPEPRPVETLLSLLVPLDEKVRTASADEDYPKALAILEEARPLRPDPEWTAGVDKRIVELRERVARLYAPVRLQALDAQRRGAAAEVQGLRDRVAKWGLAADLDKALAEVPKPPSETETYRRSWLAAIEPASGRDYTATIRDLERLAQGARAPELKAEAEADLQSFKALQAALAETLKALLATPKGQKLSVGYVEESGKPRHVEGTVVRIDGQRIELKSGEESVAIPAGELLASFVAARQPKKLGALLCALEGDLETAKQSPLEERFLSLPARDPAKDAVARQIYWTAERDLLLPVSTVDAIQALATLLKSHEDTPFVRRNRGAIQARLDGGKEYFCFSDLYKGGGSFRPAKHSKIGPCWVSTADILPGSLKDNFVDLEFSVLPETEYRCWAYVGGCCGETLAVNYQVSQLADPGSNSYATAPHGISAVSRRHSGHAAVKEATRWGWAPIPLPKFATPGAKKLRLLTEQPGFSVSCVVVSSLRTQPPPETELREREKSRPVLPSFVGGEIRSVSDQGLAGHWTFDQGAGTEATDASKSGLHGTVSGGAAWVGGRSGKALQFDGTDDFVRIPERAPLTIRTKELTMVAWVQRKGEAPGSQPVLHRQRGGYINDQYSLTLPGGVPTAVANTAGGLRTVRGPPIPVQQWVALAATFDGTVLKLFVNGVEAASDSGPAGSDVLLEEKPVTLGAGLNDDSDRPNEFFQGLIDEVRIYHRALTPAEIGALAGLRPSGR